MPRRRVDAHTLLLNPQLLRQLPREQLLVTIHLLDEDQDLRATGLAIAVDGQLAEGRPPDSVGSRLELLRGDGRGRYGVAREGSLGGGDLEGFVWVWAVEDVRVG